MVLSLPVNKNHPWHTSGPLPHAPLVWCRAGEILMAKISILHVITDCSVIPAWQKLIQMCNTRVHMWQWNLLRQISVQMECDERFVSPVRAPRSSCRDALRSIYWWLPSCSGCHQTQSLITHAPLCHDNCICRVCHLLLEAPKGGASLCHRWCLSQHELKTGKTERPRLAACVGDACASSSGRQDQRSEGKTHTLQVIWVGPLSSQPPHPQPAHPGTPPPPQHHLSFSPCTFSCGLLRSIPFTLFQLTLPPFRHHYMLEWYLACSHLQH